MNKITTAIAIMDEKGRRNAGGNSIMLWEKDWNALRELLLDASGESQQLRVHQQAETVEAGATIIGAVIDRLG